MDARHGRWPHAGINLVGDPVGLHHVRAVVKTADLALHDEKPERISRLFDETIADCSFGSRRWRACGKCRQRSLKPPSKPSERRRPLLGNFVFEACPSRTKRNQRHRGAPKHGLWLSLTYFRQGIVQVETSPTVTSILCHTFRSCSDVRRRRSACRVATRQDDECPAAYGGPL